MICALGSGVHATATPEPHERLRTDIKLTFAELVYFSELATGGMDIAFGEQPIPTGDSFILSTDGGHALKVGDRRMAASGGWSVSAKISAFASDADGSFNASLCLFSPTKTATGTGDAGKTANANRLTPNLTEGGGGTYVLIGTDSSKVMDCEQNTTGLVDFTLSCADGDARVMVASAEAAKIRESAYKATATWTLTLTG